MLMHCNMLLIDTRLKNCVLKLLMIIPLQYNLFVNNIRLTRCVLVFIILFILYLLLFSINVRLRKFVSDLHKTQKMCDYAVDDYPSILLSLSTERLEKCEIKLWRLAFPFDYLPNWYKTWCKTWWFLGSGKIYSSKMLEKFHYSLHTDDEILWFDGDFSQVTFYAK